MPDFDRDHPYDDAGRIDPAAVEWHATRQFGPSHWFPRSGDGFDILLPESGRTLVARMVADLRDLLLAGQTELTRRLYPTAYPDDPERESEFERFAHDQLLMSRLDAYDTVDRTVQADHVTAGELEAWMRVLNEARLVLGTRLDVIEDDPRDDDPEHPDAPALALYHQLGHLVGDLVDALYGTLPPPHATGPE